jgi:hypothetical protein
MSEQPRQPSDSHRDAQDAPHTDGIADLAPDVVRADAADQVKGGAEPVNGLRKPDPLRVEPING